MPRNGLFGMEGNLARQMEVMRVEGLADTLRGDVLSTPQSRMVEPDRDTLERVMQIGNAFIQHVGQQPEHQGTTIYTAYQWPETGPATLALVWGLNTRQPHDPTTDLPYFFRAFTETAEPHEHLLERADMEQQLMAYALQTFGRPSPVLG